MKSLIAAVKQYMDYEKTTLKDVVALRNQAQAAKAAGDDKARIAAENGISTIAAGLNVVFEQYPDLKAHENVLHLQEEIVNTENKLAYSKQAYNDGIEQFAAKKKSFFESMVVSYFASKLELSIIKTDGFHHCNFRGYPCCREKINMKDILCCHLMTLKDFDEFNIILKKNNFFIE